MNTPDWFDVIVIGGGPSGMMAAGRAAECGARVLLLEKNESLGKKLRITGGGRCNLANATFDHVALASKFGKNGRVLLPALARFGVADTLEFFHRNGLQTKVEEENRVFPKSDNADDVWKTLLAFMQSHGVQVRCNTQAEGLVASDGRIAGISLNGAVLSAKSYIVAVGGASRPETGSTGDGFAWLSNIGHTIAKPDAAMVPIMIAEGWVKKLQGNSLQNAKLSIVTNGKKVLRSRGKLLFAHFGVSGPLVLNMSRTIREYCNKGETVLSLDLLPDEDIAFAESRLLAIFEKNSNKLIKNVLREWIAAAFAEAVLECAGIEKEKPVREISKKERASIVATAKDMRMSIAGFASPEHAIVASGGVDVREVDFRTMRSRLYDNLFVTGDMLDFNRPSGGYSLQICWTTGHLAGQSAGEVM